MKITQDILDDLTAKAKESPRLRMNIDLRDSAEDTSHLSRWFSVSRHISHLKR